MSVLSYVFQKRAPVAWKDCLDTSCDAVLTKVNALPALCLSGRLQSLSGDAPQVVFSVSLRGLPLGGVPIRVDAVRVG